VVADSGKQKIRSGTPPSQAASSSGFSDYSGFIALFKKAYGVTPLTYKKQMRSR